MKSPKLRKFLLCGVVAAGLAGLASDSVAQTSTNTPNSNSTRRTAPPPRSASTQDKAPASESKARVLPYRGKLVSVDKQRNSITVGTRVFHVGPKTKIQKYGKTATLADGLLGQMVTGSYRKLEDGTLEAASVYFGGKVDANAAPEKKGGKSLPDRER